MSDYKTINISTDNDQIARMEFSRPEKRNALSALMISEITQASMELAQQPDIRALVLTGSGTVFSAGGDLGWMQDQMNADRETRISEATKLSNMLLTLYKFPAPVISAIHGAALGGGTGIACISDVVIAENGTKFGLTETRLGLIPATIGPFVLKKLGQGRASQIFMSGAIFDETEALKLGIVSETSSQGDLSNALERNLASYIKADISAIRAAKSLMRELSGEIDENQINTSIQRLADIWESKGAQERIAKFLNT